MTSLSYFMALKWGADRLRAAGIDSPAWQGEVLLREVLGITRADFLMTPEKAISETQMRRFSEMIQVLLGGMPLQYILGRTEFYGREFCLSPAVLIPRSDTEILVEVALQKAAFLACALGRELSVLDMCTGSGCVGLTLAAERVDLECTLSDVSFAALRIAEENAHRLGLTSRIDFELGDLWQPVAGRKFDLIVSNPPYIPTGDMASLDAVVQREPVLSLDGGADGLGFYRQMMAEAKQFLYPHGWLLFEIGATQGPAVQEIAMANGFRDVCITLDLAGRNRVIDMRP